MGPGKTFSDVGGFGPHILEGRPGLMWPAKLQKTITKIPARLLSGTQLCTSICASSSCCHVASVNVTIQFAWVFESGLVGFLVDAFLMSGRAFMGAREGLLKCEGLRPPHFGRPSRANGAGQTSQNTPPHTKIMPDCFQAPILTDSSLQRHSPVLM